MGKHSTSRGGSKLVKIMSEAVVSLPAGAELLTMFNGDQAIKIAGVTYNIDLQVYEVVEDEFVSHDFLDIGMELVDIVKTHLEEVEA